MAAKSGVVCPSTAKGIVTLPLSPHSVLSVQQYLSELLPSAATLAELDSALGPLHAVAQRLRAHRAKHDQQVQKVNHDNLQVEQRSNGGQKQNEPAWLLPVVSLTETSVRQLVYDTHNRSIINLIQAWDQQVGPPQDANLEGPLAALQALQSKALVPVLYHVTKEESDKWSPGFISANVIEDLRKNGEDPRVSGTAAVINVCVLDDPHDRDLSRRPTVYCKLWHVIIVDVSQIGMGEAWLLAIACKTPVYHEHHASLKQKPPSLGIHEAVRLAGLTTMPVYIDPDYVTRALDGLGLLRFGHHVARPHGVQGSLLSRAQQGPLNTADALEFLANASTAQKSAGILRVTLARRPRVAQQREQSSLVLPANQTVMVSQTKCCVHIWHACACNCHPCLRACRCR